jgi:hypothetical protein
MNQEKSAQSEDRYVYVKDHDGTEYVCRRSDLKRPDQLTDEEKDKCMIPPGDA